MSQQNVEVYERGTDALNAHPSRPALNLLRVVLWRGCERPTTGRADDRVGLGAALTKADHVAIASPRERSTPPGCDRALPRSLEAVPAPRRSIRATRFIRWRGVGGTKPRRDLTTRGGQHALCHGWERERLRHPAVLRGPRLGTAGRPDPRIPSRPTFLGAPAVGAATRRV